MVYAEDFKRSRETHSLLPGQADYEDVIDAVIAVSEDCSRGCMLNASCGPEGIDIGCFSRRFDNVMDVFQQEEFCKNALIRVKALLKDSNAHNV